MSKDEKPPGTRRSLFDTIIERIKNNRLFAILLLLGSVVIALSQVQDAAFNISKLLESKQSNIEVVAVRVIDDEKIISEALSAIAPQATFGTFPIIDIIVRNLGTDPSVIVGAEYTAFKDSESDPYITACGVVTPSQLYNILLNSDEVFQKGIVPVTQEVPPKGTDRFILIIGSVKANDWDKARRVEEYFFEEGDFTYYRSYLINLILKVNSDEEIDLGTHRVYIRTPSPCSIGLKRTDVIRVNGE